MEVANSIGRFILMEENQILVLEWKIPRMLVDIKVSCGLPEEMEVVWDGVSFIQRIDY